MGLRTVSLRRATGALVTALLAASLMTPAGSATASAVGSATPSARVGHYTPSAGVIFNAPLSPKRRHVINRHIRLSIDSAPKGSKIRIMSWNVKSELYRNSLIRAHQRGVSVRVIMSNGLAKQQSSDGDYQRLKRALRKGQANRKPDMKSWIRACVASCRGTRGIAHVKFYTFSQAGRARDVVMTGSANMTEVSASNQWNDMFTVKGDHGLWSEYQRIFAQAAKDRRANPPYQTYQVNKKMLAWFLPYLGGKATGDPVLKILKNVKCKGATGKSGMSGRTAIRVGQTAILNDRGVAIAKKLKGLYNDGCNVRLIYTVLGPQIADLLRTPGPRGLFPMRQIAQDTNGDGSFDRYLHMKDMTISGHYGKVTDAHLIYNGTQNWTAVSALSDEAGFTFFNSGIERKYSGWINTLFNNPPFNPNPVPDGGGGGDRPTTYGQTRNGVDPYAHVQLN